jgi:ACS family sodium-dependent inorganic phosphate cotransporter-like MFS transporter 5
MCGGKKRFSFTFLTALVTIFHYISQLTLPFTITVMSQPPEEDSQSICAVNSSISEERRETGSSTEFTWTNQMYGNILGAYFIGYSVSAVLSSFAVQKFGFYPLIKLLCFGSASTTFLFPFVIKRSFYLGVILRICQGIFSGPYVPAFQGSWYWWGIPSEITTNIAIQTGGVTLGNIFGSVGTGFVIRRLGWEYSFYLAGAAQVLVGVLWVLLVDPKPETERSEDFGFCSWKKLKIASALTPEEKQLLKASRPPSTMTTKLSEIPLKAILTDPQVHLAVFGSFSVSLILLSCMTNTPTYLKRAFGLPIETITMCFGSIALGCLILNVLTAVFGE